VAIIIRQLSCETAISAPPLEIILARLSHKRREDTKFF